MYEILKEDDLQKIERIFKANLGKNFGLFFDTPEKREQILKEVQLVLDELQIAETEGLFDWWGCARCIAANLAVGIAVTAAVTAFAPASSGVVPYVMQAFGLSEPVATAIVVVGLGLWLQR